MTTLDGNPKQSSKLANGYVSLKKELNHPFNNSVLTITAIVVQTTTHQATAVCEIYLLGFQLYL